MATASTLRTFRIGGQVDPAWAASGLPWTAVRAVATLSSPAGGAPVVDPTNGAHEHPLTVANILTSAAAAGMWSTAALKPTQSTGANLALAPSGLAWTVTISLQRGNGWNGVAAYTVALSGDYDYSGHGQLLTIAGASCVDINALIPIPITVPTSNAFATAVLGVLTDNPAAVVTNLSLTRTATAAAIASSTGTDAEIPAATGSLAGLLTADDKTKLDALATVGASNLIATASTPTSGDGANGDFHLNVANGEITGPKAAGAWPTHGNVGNAYAANLAAATLTPTLAGSAGSAITAARSDHRHAQARGSSLPATDGSEGIMHVLQGHSTMPDGFYVLIGTAWVQVGG